MSPRFFSAEPAPAVSAIARKAACTPAIVSGAILNMVRWVARAAAATLPRSPSVASSAFTRASVRPVASASARTSVASPTPSSTPACAGATRLTHRQTAGRRSAGVVRITARNAVVSLCAMTRRLVSSATDSKTSARKAKGAGVDGAHVEAASTSAAAWSPAAARAPAPTPSTFSRFLFLVGRAGFLGAGTVFFSATGDADRGGGGGASRFGSAFTPGESSSTATAASASALASVLTSGAGDGDGVAASPFLRSRFFLAGASAAGDGWRDWKEKGKAFVGRRAARDARIRAPPAFPTRRPTSRLPEPPSFSALTATEASAAAPPDRAAGAPKKAPMPGCLGSLAFGGDMAAGARDSAPRGESGGARPRGE